MSAPRRIALLALLAFVTAGCSGAVATPLASPAAQEATPVASSVPAVPVPVSVEPVLPKGTFVARSKSPNLTIWRRPTIASGQRFSFPSRNPVGQPLSFLVTSTARDTAGDPWLRILLPIRPNESAGWVRMAAVTTHRARERIVVDLSERSLRYYRRGQLADRFSVGIGASSTPTAVGTFYVWAQVPQASASGPYGIFALGLSGFSPVLKDWPGGGRMAIHGTPNPGDRGQMVSHGCVRVYNDDMTRLRHVPLGTPVVIQT
jgi:lipoprotein-anchoring transpeptidase ErfK/SrfK